MTVVEWGEGLAEGLSADRLEIAIKTKRFRPGGAVADTDPDDLRRRYAAHGADTRRSASAGKASSCPSWASLIVYSSALYHPFYPLHLVSRSPTSPGGMP